MVSTFHTFLREPRSAPPINSYHGDLISAFILDIPFKPLSQQFLVSVPAQRGVGLGSGFGKPWIPALLFVTSGKTLAEPQFLHL